MARVVGNGKLGTLTTALGSSNMVSAISNHYPSRTTPLAMSAIVTDTFVNFGANTSSGGNSSGTIGVVSGFTASSGLSSLSVNYCNITEAGNITLRAIATYPHHVAGWYSATNGGGTELVGGGSGNSTLDIVIDGTSAAVYNNFYAHFGAAAASFTSISLSYGTTAAQSCNLNAITYYTAGTTNTWDSNFLYANSAGTMNAPAQYYSDGLKTAYYNGSGSWSQHGACTF